MLEWPSLLTTELKYIQSSKKKLELPVWDSALLSTLSRGITALSVRADGTFPSEGLMTRL